MKKHYRLSVLLLVMAVGQTQICLISGLSTSTTPVTILTTKDGSTNKVEYSERLSTFPNSIPLNEPIDRQVFQRQTGQINPSKAAIGKPSTCMCKHGFPQVFVMDPMHNGRLNSGLLKLTCPLLVNAIDSIEDNGMINRINQRIKHDDEYNSTNLRSFMIDSHQRHAMSRTQMLDKVCDSEEIESKLGPKGLLSFMNSGIAGSTLESSDVKCLHAWYADSLFFQIHEKIDDDDDDDGQNQKDSLETASRNGHILGDLIRHELLQQEEKNIVHHNEKSSILYGTSTCNVLCDPSMSMSLANPPKPRNKQRLRTSKELDRKRRKKTI